jgi:AraC family transcriptional regulator, regulatory protein of adaptative response / methylphosphotriester-DNA alkyltransferase methyltransferase
MLNFVTENCKLSNIMPSNRQQEIIAKYNFELDKHLSELKAGKAEKTFEIKDLADLLFIHPVHLSNTIHEVLGQSPCDIYEEKLILIAKELLLASDRPVARIAENLTYDPSNFTKFFKRFTGMTPTEFRKINSTSK